VPVEMLGRFFGERRRFRQSGVQHQRVDAAVQPLRLTHDPFQIGLGGGIGFDAPRRRTDTFSRGSDLSLPAPGQDDRSPFFRESGGGRKADPPAPPTTSAILPVILAIVRPST
jgi:hypothetical protein